jgi:hypothetical protein
MASLLPNTEVAVKIMVDQKGLLKKAEMTSKYEVTEVKDDNVA